MWPFSSSDNDKSDENKKEDTPCPHDDLGKPEHPFYCDMETGELIPNNGCPVCHRTRDHKYENIAVVGTPITEYND